MIKTQVIKRIRDIGIVPVIRAGSEDEARQVVDAVFAGGISVFEITMTVPGAVSLISRLILDFGDKATIGAGTVLDAETGENCLAAGAQFIVCPMLELDVIQICKEADIAVFPGALTPTEILLAWNAGADAVKIFPASSVGGPDYLKAIKAPLPQIELMPTGGVTLSNAGDYIRSGAIAVGVGGDLVDIEAVRSGKPEKITQTARNFLETVREARFG